MAGNSFGEILRVSTFGESHGTAMGGMLDGMPAGIWMDVAAVQAALDRRRADSAASFAVRIVVASSAITAASSPPR